MVVKLEELIEVPGRYDEVCVNKDHIVGSRITFGKEDHYLDLLAHDGKLVKQFGKDHARRFLPSKILYRDFNPFGGPGDFTLFTLVGAYISYVPQVIYNAATSALQNNEPRHLAKAKDHIKYPMSIACTDDRIFVLDYGTFWLNNAVSYEVTTANIAVFDNDGNGIKKMLSLGQDAGHIAFHPNTRRYAAIQVKDDKLYLLDQGEGLRLQRFDLEGNLEQVIFQEHIPYQFHSYCDFAVGNDCIYITLDGGKDECWNSVGKITMDGSFEVFDLSALCRLTDGIAVTDQGVIVRDRDAFHTFTYGMEHAGTCRIPELESSGFEYRLLSDSHSLAYNKCHLYAPVTLGGAVTHHLDGTMEKKKGHMWVAKMKVD
ncbi:hypothetical protein HY772_07275 [Candidatus Woesearchaeota archaeon]|nr:hypothetical protein [Candidatus Woesearchaeota archaeon]